MKRLGGVHTPHWKTTANSPAEHLPIPPEVRLPMAMHIGAPAKAVVKAGDEVKVGQLIGEAAGFISSPIYASVSGTVSRVDETDPVTGQNAASVTIASDGMYTYFEGLKPPEINDLAGFLEAVRASGVVGLGGAGFPTIAKLTVKDTARIDCVIVNGAECEPYITSDTRTMVEDKEHIWNTLRLMNTHMKPGKIVVAIENNKPEPIKLMREMAAAEPLAEIRVLPSVYPQGGEKILIYNVTGRVVPEGKLPLDVGVLVINCATLAIISRYITSGKPLVSKCVTVDGTAVQNPKNLIAPIGTPVSVLFDYCGLKCEPGKILMGGPMMGIAIPNADMPILKNTNAVLAFAEAEAILPEESPCINCGRCARACPMGLMPAGIRKNFGLKKPELLASFKTNLCIECGCCAFSCPAKIPLVQYMKLAKAALRDYSAAKTAAK
ncbi:MAG: electron transport complex subunit RsxC [Oscillospiraceae bacterium]|jgi:electron transport complex protein RnfC|nr:electron transport complex subunit RsxC [Oscillospiraceae bacterium]